MDIIFVLIGCGLLWFLYSILKELRTITQTISPVIKVELRKLDNELEVGLRKLKKETDEMRDLKI